MRYRKGTTLALLFLVWFSMFRLAHLRGNPAEITVQVAVVYDAGLTEDEDSIRQAYEAVLVEEGVPHEWLSTSDLLLISGEELARRYAALIFPDALAQTMPTESLARAEEFVAAGGDVAIILDPGIKDPSGAYRPGGVLASLAGVEYQRYRVERSRAYVKGSIDFTSADGPSEWGIPPGKLHDGHVVGGYAYGSLEYPMASAEVIDPDVSVIASFDSIPVISERRVKSGRVLWVNLPLGYLKANGDDLPLRSIVRTFLFDRVRLPHLVSSPGGVGGLVIDWHVDSQVEWEGIPGLIESGVVRPGLRMQFDVTAGPYRDSPGDGIGFDACGRGRSVLSSVLQFGEIGSHGGWSHNYFSDRLEHGELEPHEIEAFIDLNNDCVEEVAGRRPRAYSAPNGVHPPEVTEMLEQRDFVAYYYTGDTGSPPTRTFVDGQMVSTEMWAFPVMPNGLQASIGEMERAGLSPAEVGAWLNDTLDYITTQRAIRLIYSHPYDLTGEYRTATKSWLDRAEALQRLGRLRVEPMAYFANFLDRFVETDYSIRRADGGVEVNLTNEGGLEDIAIAVPSDWVDPSAVTPAGVMRTSVDSAFITYVITTDARELQFLLRAPS
jgi:hypothetical protein